MGAVNERLDMACIAQVRLGYLEVQHGEPIPTDSCTVARDCGASGVGSSCCFPSPGLRSDCLGLFGPSNCAGVCSAHDWFDGPRTRGAVGLTDAHSPVGDPVQFTC